MGKYIVEIEGKYGLDQINLQVSREEAAASLFVQSTVSSYNGRITNLVEFEELEPGTRPKPIHLVKDGSAPPNGTTKIWSGVMIVENQNQAVIAYRST